MSVTATPRRGMNKGLCTRHVSINLNKSVGGNKDAWQRFSLDSLEDFTRQAKAYLKDASNLKGSTIDGADYAELLEYFRKIAGWKPKRLAAKPVSQAVADRIKVRKALEKITMDEKPSPKAKKRVSVSVSVPPVLSVTTQVPARKRSDIPENWVYMAKHADTPAAQEWWARYCERWLRGDV